MKTRPFAQQLAVVCMAINGALSLTNMVSLPAGSKIIIVLQIVFTIAFWAFLIQKMWRRPRQWGFGVGLFLLIQFVLQTYLWRLALAGPLPERLGLARNPWIFALYEIPIVSAAISCFYMRWGYLLQEVSVLSPEA